MSTTTIDRTAVTTPTDAARRWPVTSALLIAAALLAAVGAGWLMSAFGWPDVLDARGSEALPSFAASESAVRTAFYLLLVSSLLLIPAAIYLEQLVGGPARPGVRVVTAFGVLGGFAQVLGWVRWPVTVPHLADAYSTSDETTRGAIAASYDVLNRYAGGALGEHLGWLFQGLWAVGIAILLLRVTGIPRWFTIIGLALSVLWLPMLWGSGLFAAEWLAPVGSTISAVWYLWLLALGVVVLVREVGPVSIRSGR
jgi:hypothetical protein